MKHILFGLFLIFATVHCSNSKSSKGIPGANLPALTSDQKDRVTQFNDSVELIGAATKSKLPQSGQTTLITSTSQKAASDKAKQDLIDKMNWAEANSYCQSNVTSSPSLDFMSLPSATITISGSRCPMKYSMNLQSKNLSSGGQALAIEMTNTEDFSVQPAVVPDLTLNLDITQYTSQDSFKVSANGNQSHVNMLMTRTRALNATSISMGKIATNLNMSSTTSMQISNTGELASMNAQITITYSQKFSDFSVVGYMLSTMKTSPAQQGQENVTSQFYVNGKTVSEAEFGDLFGSAVTAVPMQ